MAAGALVAETVATLRREWRAVVVWIAIHVVAGVAAFFLLRPMMRSRLDATIAMSAAPPTPPMVWLVVPIALLLALALYNAAFRAALQPEARRGSFVRLGIDEARLLALAILLSIAAYLGLVLVSLATALVASAAAQLFAIAPGSPGATWLVLAGAAAPLLALLHVTVRLSPAAPLTLLRGKLMIGPAWRLTRGRTLPLIGAYAIVAAILALAYALVVWATMRPTLAALATPDPTLRRWRLLLLEQTEWGNSSGRLLVATVAGGVLAALIVAAQGIVTAVATRRLLDGSARDYAPPEDAKGGAA